MRIAQHRDDLVRRVGWFHGAAQAVLLLVVGGYWLVQVAEGSAYRELAENNRLRKLSIEAPRGLIRDRHGSPLVENVPRYSLLIDRSRSRDLEASVVFAAEILDRPASELRGILAGHRQTPSFKPVLLAGELSLQQVARFGVEHFEHPEFEIAVHHLRLYRHAHQTAHILGYLGEVTDAELHRPGNTYRAGDTVGKEGIEGLYESHLRGRRGEQVVVVDSRGRSIEEYDRVPATAGRDLTLTIDLALQQEASNQLAGKVGAIVALDPRQGEVLAMVSSPSFNPNRFARRLRPEEWRELVEDPHHPLQNRAVQNAYPPGSTFKIVMALAGLDLGLIDPQAFPVSCRGFSIVYNNRYRCWKSSGHGPVDLKRSLQHSCNVYYHHLGQKLGIDQIAAYGRRLGLGAETGIDLAGERAGLIPDSRWSLEHRGAPWYPGETISVATGQGPILTTPVQLAVLMAAVANGGRRVTPHLVKTVFDGTEAGVRPPGVRPAGPSRPAERLSTEHLELVREALWSVVNEPRGTGGSARVEGLDIAGKTGTAQVVSQESRTKSEDLPLELRDHGWFVSFAPLADPRLVVVVFVEHGGSGSRAAAPLARGLYERYFRG